MVTYKYTALSKDGERVSGVIEGFNEMDAAARIKESCDVILKLTEVKESKLDFLSGDIGKPKLKAKAFTMMCSQFAIILRAGLPVARTVELIAAKTSDKTLKRMLKSIAADVENGRSLAASFEERGGEFLPKTFIETIRAGEASGNIDAAFESMYQHFDKQAKLKSKIRNAMIYPIFVLVIAVAVVIVLMVAVVPTFEEIFASYGSELPGITLALIAISNFFSNYIIYIGIFILALIVAYKIYAHTETGHLNTAYWKFKIPVLRNITTLTAASEFSNTMATMMAAGIPLTRAISITARVMSNYFASHHVGKMNEKIEQGQRLSSGLKDMEVMPDILIDMVAVGENTGELEDTMKTISKYYDAELEVAIEGLVNKLSPAILLVVAAIAGFIVIAIYIAMFEMYNIM